MGAWLNRHHPKHVSTPNMKQLLNPAGSRPTHTTTRISPKCYNVYLSMRPVQETTCGLLKNYIYIHSELFMSELRMLYIAKIRVKYALYPSVRHLSSSPSPPPSSLFTPPFAPLRVQTCIGLWQHVCKLML